MRSIQQILWRSNSAELEDKIICVTNFTRPHIKIHAKTRIQIVFRFLPIGF